MKHRYKWLCLIALLLTPLTLTANEIDPIKGKWKGFGMDTPGGRGGDIIKVTNLKPSGPGSLRAALDHDGPRIVVFEVGGVIDLQKKNMSIRHPFITIAGQTAPSPGITIIRGSIYIHTHDVILQHLRVRPGDAGMPKRSGWSPDGISTSAAHNILFDHCSTTWAVDENLSVSGPRLEGPEATSRNVTISHCIIAEGLDDSSHEKGPHSKGTLIHDYCQNIAVIGNLYAHNVDRNPYFKAFTTGLVVNNIIYNPGRRAVNVGYAPSEWEDIDIEPQNCQISVIGNVLIHGQDTRSDLALIANRGDVYFKDNIIRNRENQPASLISGDIKRLFEKPVWPGGFAPLPAKETVDYLIKHVGARPNDRDEIDQRIIREFQTRQGRIIDSQEEVGGYPNHKMTKRKLDIPSENTEEWLRSFSRALEENTSINSHSG